MSFVICVRCLNGYDPKIVERRKTKRLQVKEPACPRCKCKIYFNRQDAKPLVIAFEKEQFTATEDE